MRTQDAPATNPAALVDALAATIVGQREVVEGLVLALMAGGHCLLEGPPGVAKTLACRALAAAIGGSFKRIQFTPDLLPSDIVGTRIFDQRAGDFHTVQGPIFANIVLADEINRAPAKVQSALLEGMQEHQATIGPQTFAFPEPFAVMATMNPLESEGTYALPLAQMDRFLVKILVDYPTADEELAILDRYAGAEPSFARDVVSPQDIMRWRASAHDVHIEAKAKRYIVAIVSATRAPATYGLDAAAIDRGASPRATLAIASLARARALLDGRDYVVPDDVKAIAPAVLRHRVAWSYRMLADRVDPETVLRDLIARVPTP